MTPVTSSIAITWDTEENTSVSCTVVVRWNTLNSIGAAKTRNVRWNTFLNPVRRPLGVRTGIADWNFALLEQGDGAAPSVITDLTSARSRKLTVSLANTSECSFSIDGRHADSLDIQELATDVLVSRNGTDLFRGRIGPTSDSISADKHDLDVKAIGYKSVLDRRIIFPDSTLTFTGVDQEQIGWQLIADTQARSDLGITRGVGQSTGVLRDRTYEAGKTVGSAIDDLSQVIGGFEWDIEPDLSYKVYYPQRGSTDPTFLLEFGGALTSMKRSVNPADYSNVIRLLGGKATLPTSPKPTLSLGSGGYFEPGQTFQYAIGVVTAEGVSPVGEVSQFTIPAGVWDGKVNISWASVPGALSYTVYGRAVGQPLKKIDFDRSNRTSTSYVDGGDFAPSGDAPTGSNDVEVSQIAYSSTADGSPEGYWESQITDNDLTKQSSVDDKAQWSVERHGELLPSYTVEINPSFWNGPEDLWVGDTVMLDANSGRLRVQRDDLRVTEMTFSIDENGKETIGAVLGYRSLNIFEKVSKLKTRLDQLERK